MQQMADVRREIGNKPSDAEVNVIFDRLGDLDETINEILETRLATMLAAPAQFAVSGEYSQSNAENIKALRERLDERGVSGMGELTFIPAPDPKIR